MALLATLQIGNNSEGIYHNNYLVVRCNYSFSRQHNVRVPNSVPKNNKLNIVIVAPNGDDMLLYDWYINKEVFSGRLVFDMSSVNDENPKVLQFENAQCYAISENYDIDGMYRRLISLCVSAETSQCDSEVFTNY